LLSLPRNDHACYPLTQAKTDELEAAKLVGSIRTSANKRLDKQASQSVKEIKDRKFGSDVEPWLNRLLDSNSKCSQRYDKSPGEYTTDTSVSSR